MDTLTSLSAEAKAYYDRKLLMRAIPKLGLYGIGQQRNIPKRGGNQVSYRRFNALTTATTALSEGVTPTASSLSVTEITGTVAQYGNYVVITDMVDLMAIDPVISESTDVLGENAGQSVEEIIRAVLVAGTSVVYATGTTRVEQDAAHPLTYAMVKKGVRTLETNDAEPFYGERDKMGQGGMYMGYVHPKQFYDLIGDSTVQTTFQYSDPGKLYTMRVPEVGQVAWMKTTKAPIFTGLGASGVDVYGAFIFGKEAYGVVDVAGTGQFQTKVKPIGSGGTSDPLDQRGTVGWKSLQLPKILNNNFFVRLESGVSA